MSAARLPFNQTRNPKTGRKPLRPTNSLPNRHVIKMVINPHPLLNDRNKENPHPVEPMIDASLAEELKAMRERKERLRVEREKTEAVMRERIMVLDRKMEEMRERGEVQRMLEIQVDRLFRLKEIQTQSKKNSPVRSLRDKEQGAKIREGQPQGINSESTSECTRGSQLQSSSSEIHTEN